MKYTGKKVEFEETKPIEKLMTNTTLTRLSLLDKNECIIFLADLMIIFFEQLVVLEKMK